MQMQHMEGVRVRTVLDACCESARHVPQDKADWKPEATSKSAKEILEHLTATNKGFASSLRGDELNFSIPRDELIHNKLEAANYGEALEIFKSSGEALAKTIESLPDEQLGETREMPWGETWEVMRLITTASVHIAYHMGQINYLQTLWGDEKDYM